MSQDLPITSYALLGLLTLGDELTGYELKQRADITMRFYWVSPAMSQVYSELGRLTEAGLVEPTGKGRGRRYRITPQGRQALAGWLEATPPGFPVLKHPVALRLMNGHVGGDEHAVEMLRTYADALADARADLQAVRDMLRGSDDVGAPFRFPAIVAEWGLGYFDAEETSTRRSLHRLQGAAPRRLIGVTGPPGSDTAGVSGRLAREHDAVVVPMAGFRLSDAVLTGHGTPDRTGAPETVDAAGYAALLQRLRADTGDTVYAPGTAHDGGQPLAGAIAIGPETRVVVAEGSYLLLDRPEWRAVHRQLDEVVFVDVPDDVRRERLLARQRELGRGAAEAAAWVDRVDEPHARLVAAARDRADRIETTV